MLPTTKTKPKNSLQDLSILIYGPSKIGKSTWCSHADNALFLATEPGLNSLEVFQLPIKSWSDLSRACEEVHQGKHNFRTIIVDTIDNAYKLCAKHVCKEHSIKHESDLGYGKGFALVNFEFHRLITKLAQLPYGVIFVSHSQERENKGRIQFTKAVPTLPEKAGEIVTGLVDIILYCGFEEQASKNGDGPKQINRVVYTKSDQYHVAGDRTGRLPPVMPLDFAEIETALAGNK